MTHSLWVNVTTLMNWNRPAVGVVRVEQEYIRWLLSADNLGPNWHVHFVVFDRHRNQFSEISRDQVAARLFQNFVAEQTTPPSAEERFKAFARRYIRFIPPTAIPRARLIALALIRFLSRARAKIRQIRERLRLSLGRAPDSAGAFDQPMSQAVRFSKGDCFVSMGLDWDQLDMATLYQLKTEQGLRITLMCYDTIPVLFPQLVVAYPAGFGAYLTELAWCADLVMCISENTRKDFCAFMERMGGPAPKTTVIRLGDSFPEARMAVDDNSVNQAVRRCADRPFVLFVSTIERRKNHELLYRVWVRLKERGIAVPKLIFVGMPGWGVNDFLADLRLDPRIAGDIESLNHVSDQDLHWLYRHALFTVYPSLYEGWGLPVTESLAHGKFCLCSNAASIPEAGGALCEYLDPWDLPAWVQRIAELLSQPDQLAVLNERVREGFVPTHWSATAAQIHRAVATLVETNP